MHLFRLYPGDDAHARASRLSPLAYLQAEAGLTALEATALADEFPPLRQLDTLRHVAPKLAFLKGVLLREPGAKGALPLGRVGALANGLVPPQFFGARLERTLAPRHAFLASRPGELPSGPMLLEHAGPENRTGSGVAYNETLLWALLSARSDADFAALCTVWRRRGGWQAKSSDQPLRSAHQGNSEAAAITVRDVERFTVVFRRGLLNVAKNGELVEDLANAGYGP
jgi:hypothetical protein